MIDEYNKGTVRAASGKDVEVEVNFRNDPEDVDNKKMLRVSIGDEHSVIKIDDLVQVLMLYGSQENVNDLIPTKMTNVSRYDTILEFQWTASRDIRKGEKLSIAAPYVRDVVREQETFAGALKKKKDVLKGRKLYEAKRIG